VSAVGKRRPKAIVLLAVAAAAIAVGVVAHATHLLRRTEYQTIDARFSIRGGQPVPSDIVLVLIDNATFQEMTRLRLHSEFPFPRRYDAELIDRLRRAGAKTIALDLEFSRETDPRDDNALIEAIGRARKRVVLAAAEVGAGGQTRVLGGGDLPAKLGARVAEVLLTVDSDGAVRRFAHSYNGLPSFAVAVAETASGRHVSASSFEDGTLPIDYAGPPGTIRAISFSRVLRGRFAPSLFRGKTVIVGASAPILQDVHSTATTGSQVMSGPEIWANATETLLRGAPLRDAPGWLNVALIALLGVAVPFGSLRVRRWRYLLDALALAALFALAAQIAFDNGLIVGLVPPLLTLSVATLGTLAILYVGEAIERERVRAVFSRFVPADVVEEVLASADDNLRLAGVERDCTVLFCDLRGFTGFSESQPAARVIEVVNFYLNEMSEAILEAGGTLVSYMGDGIMAIFGAPLRQDDHADRAVAAAREMIGPRLDRFNAWLAEHGFGAGFRMGVGLNSGPVMVGNVGSEQRVEYTAIGDTVNTASRLEGMTKGSEAMLYIAASTRERLRAARGDLSPVGEVEIRGRSGKLGVWTIGPPGAGSAA
jgi:adenylate cyclase